MWYITSMAQQNNFDKINDFVKQQLITDNSVIIQSVDQGFKVNHYTIREEGDFWSVYNLTNDRAQQFFSRKYAVLAAVLMSKQRHKDVFLLKNLDLQLSIAGNDQIHYERLLRKNCNSGNESMYIARLSKAQQVLENVRSKIKDLEKSLQLQ